MVDFSLELLGHPIMAHFDRLGSIYDKFVEFGYLWLDVLYVVCNDCQIICICCCGGVAEEVLKWYPMLSFSSHLRRGSRKMINRYGLSVSPCIVPLLIFIGSIVPK